MDFNKILLVDDEEELTTPLSRLLRREGYDVDVATDGEQALISIGCSAVSPYQLIILDWMLPVCSGLEVCRQIRQQSNMTPVLFLTAKDTLDDRVQGLDVGADDYLVKPFELRELLARVRALLRRQEQFLRPGPNPNALESNSFPLRLVADGLELDQENQMAYRAGHAIALSEKETQLLTYLMQHPQVILTHDELYEQLWSREDKPGSNVLAAQMRLLRRKIERDQAKPLIHTIYGKGYRFGPE